MGRFASWLACLLLPLAAQAGVLVIGHPGLPRLDAGTVQKIYTGKIVEIAGINVTAINIRSGSTLRNEFLQTYLNQDDEKYLAYWTVRRYIGKGVPPPDVATSADVVAYILAHAGAIGYIDEADLKPGVTVLLRK